jgi:ketosteroid isomerase-like protein
MPEQEDEARIRQLMGEISRAFIHRDVAALNEVLADDFTFSDPSGPVVNKAQWLSDLASGELTVEQVDHPGAMQLSHRGDAVIVRGEFILRARYTKSDYNGAFRYLGVYRKVGEDWKLQLTSADRSTNLHN